MLEDDAFDITHVDVSKALGTKHRVIEETPSLNIQDKWFDSEYHFKIFLPSLERREDILDTVSMITDGRDRLKGLIEI